MARKRLAGQSQAPLRISYVFSFKYNYTLAFLIKRFSKFFNDLHMCDCTSQFQLHTWDLIKVMPNPVLVYSVVPHQTAGIPPTLRLRRITLTLRQEIEKIYFVPGKRIYLRIQLHSGMETWMLFHVKSCTFLMWYGELFPPPYTLHAVVGKNVPCCAQVARISAESWNCSPDITVWIQTPLECAAVTTMVSGALT